MKSLIRWTLVAGLVVGIPIRSNSQDVERNSSDSQSGPTRVELRRTGADSATPGDTESPASALTPENRPGHVAILSEDELKQLLGARLDGGMGRSFGQFANMFLVSSSLHFGTAVGLMSDNSKIIRTELQSPFPSSYSPTLREFLDSIALQTFSEWKYETTGRFLKINVKLTAPVKDMAFFEFTPIKRVKPFEIILAEGWKAIDRGNWVMYVPTSFPVGMDIYEMGTYSTKDDADQREFMKEIRQSVALEWAQRMNPRAEKSDLVMARVGKHKALHYDTLLKGRGKEIHWRHWVLVDGNKCYFIVSTIVPQLEDDILPDVRKMLESFSIQ